jgi:hypothetical protein
MEIATPKEMTVWIVAFGEAYEGYKIVSIHTDYGDAERATREYAAEHLVWGDGPTTCATDERNDSATLSRGCDRVYLFPMETKTS